MTRAERVVVAAIVVLILVAVWLVAIGSQAVR